MRILIHGLNFSPEITGVGKYTGEMAEWLLERGHDILVVTAPPYYPEWKIKAGYTNLHYSQKDIVPEFQSESRCKSKCTVIRCPIFLPQRPTSFLRILHHASFGLTSLLAMIKAIQWRPDVVICIAPSLIAAPVSLFLARFAHIPAVLHVQDLELDAALNLGMLRGATFKWLLSKAETFILKQFDCVTTISRNMFNKLAEKGISINRLALFPNWVDTTLIYPLTQPNSFRSILNLKVDTLVALYSGSMGHKQGLETILDAASLLKDQPYIVFVLCGNGPTRITLETAATGMLNVKFIDLQPADRLNELLNLADIHLMPQRAGAADLVMPSKILGMFASGRPTIATANPGTQLFKAVSNCGIVVPPEDSVSLARAVRDLAETPKRRLDLGNSARTYAIHEWGKENILKTFENTLKMLIKLVDNDEI